MIIDFFVIFFVFIIENLFFFIYSRFRLFRVVYLFGFWCGKFLNCNIEKSV